MTVTDFAGHFPAAQYAATLTEGNRNAFAMFSNSVPYEAVEAFLRRQVTRGRRGRRTHAVPVWFFR